MINPFEIMETINMIREENLDIVYLENGVFRSSTGTIRGRDYLYR